MNQGRLLNRGAYVLYFKEYFIYLHLGIKHIHNLNSTLTTYTYTIISFSHSVRCAVISDGHNLAICCVPTTRTEV